MNKTIRTVIAICLASVLLCSGICLGTVSYIRHSDTSLSAPPAEIAPLDAAAEGYVSTAFAPAPAASAGTEARLSASEIYDLACKQVVGISTTVQGYNMFGQLSSTAVSGTGFILSEDGYILTNNHLVEKAMRNGGTVKVIFHDGSEYEAEIMGAEGTQTDIALLKIDAKGLTPVVLGDSDEMKVGEQAYVVGNPLGELTYTLTSGIISALDREIATERNVRVHMFQLDAAINNGNSGGPVYNDRGEVIGVVTAKYKSAGIEGLGFAIPVNTARAIAESIRDKGYVTGKPYFGIIVTNQTYEDVEAADGVRGVMVYSVDEGSCAEKAGMQAGDLIVAMGGTDVETMDDITRVKLDYRAGDECQVKIWREGEYMTLTVVFDEEPPESEKTPLPQIEETPRSSAPESGSDAEEPQTEEPQDEDPYYDSFDDWMDDFFGRFFDYFGDEGQEEEGSGDTPRSGSSSKGFRHFG
ncbi:MAG: trypsin-like peptidase domain-containing protein [Oscillospiraceae bacterium]|nr:trypsin-like peptidase domain-containing protein [Oscillospiraceae bacterium]